MKMRASKQILSTKGYISSSFYNFTKKKDISGFA